MPALDLQEVINFSTPQGRKSVQLYFGDITAYSAKDPADILMVSAFSGDYSPVSGTLIGALNRNLNISVRNLAKDKEADLRKFFHCWWSKPLEPGLPYRRILCFESSGSGLSADRAVESIFNALVPAESLFGKGTIMSPLLSSGCQDYGEKLMLVSLVNVAIKWMKMGLNAECFKLVVYSGSKEHISAFRKLKSKYEAPVVLPAPPGLPPPAPPGLPPPAPPGLPSPAPPGPPPPADPGHDCVPTPPPPNPSRKKKGTISEFTPHNRGNAADEVQHNPHEIFEMFRFKRQSAVIRTVTDRAQNNKKEEEKDESERKRTVTSHEEYDFFLSYDEKNIDKVQEVKSMILSTEPGPKLKLKEMTEEEKMEAESDLDYYQQLFMRCSRVITFLSPEFLGNSYCISHYNTAYMMSKTSSSKLVPMLCVDIPKDEMPTYITLVQWVDVRIRDGRQKMVKNITVYINTYLNTAFTEMNVLDPTTPNTAHIPTAPALKSSDGPELETSICPEYDIFISYCHANEPIVLNIIDALKKAKPDIKLFVDRAELHTGGAWQQTLYYSLESCQIILACLSEAYIKSKMCNEEFRIGLARYYSETSFHLVSIEVAPLGKDVPELFEALNIINVKSNSEKVLETQIVPNLISHLNTGSGDGYVVPLSKEVGDLNTILQDGRGATFPPLLKSLGAFKAEEGRYKPTVQILGVGEGANDYKIAQQICETLPKNGYTVRLPPRGADEGPLLDSLDDADLIVPLISQSFIKSADRISELQVAIMRQRAVPGNGIQILYPVLLETNLSAVQTSYHLYLSLLNYEICLQDPIIGSQEVEDLMKDIPDLSDCVKTCEEMRAKKAEENHKLEPELNQLKFVKVICCRIKSLLGLHNRKSEVLVNVYEAMKMCVSKSLDAKFEQRKVKKLIRQLYSNKQATDSIKSTEKSPPTSSATKAQVMKAKHEDKMKSENQTSSICTIL